MVSSPTEHTYLFDLIPQTPIPTPVNLSHKSIVSNGIQNVSFPFPTHKHTQTPRHYAIPCTFSGHSRHRPPHNSVTQHRLPAAIGDTLLEPQSRSQLSTPPETAAAAAAAAHRLRDLFTFTSEYPSSGHNSITSTISACTCEQHESDTDAHTQMCVPEKRRSFYMLVLQRIAHK